MKKIIIILFTSLTCLLLSSSYNLIFATSNQVSVTELDQKISQLENQIKILTEQQNKYDEKGQLQFYKDQNQNILNTTDTAIKNISNMIYVLGIVITFFTGIGTILIPILLNKKEKERFRDVTIKLDSLKKEFDDKNKLISDDIKEKSLLFENQSEALKNDMNSIEEKLNNFLNKAKESADKAKESENITNAAMYYYEGNSKYSSSDYISALENYEKALQFTPDKPLLYNNCGNCNFALGRLDEAIKDYSKAILLDSTVDYYYSNRGKAYFELKLIELAIADFDKAISLNPCEKNYLIRSRIYRYLGNYSLAIRDYLASLNHNPINAETLNTIADLYITIGDLNSALNYANRAIDVDPEYGYAYATLAEISILQEKTENFYKNIELAFKNKFPIKQVYLNDLYKKFIDSPELNNIISKYLDLNNSNESDNRKKEIPYNLYVNPRYGFSIEYPSILIEKKESNIGEGIILSSSENNIELTVYSLNNRSNETAESTLKSILKEHKDILFKEKKGNWFIVSWSDGDKIIYYKCVVGEWSSNAFIFKYPSSEKKYYTQIIDRMNLSFKTPGINIED